MHAGKPLAIEHKASCSMSMLNSRLSTMLQSRIRLCLWDSLACNCKTGPCEHLGVGHLPYICGALCLTAQTNADSAAPEKPLVWGSTHWPL